MSIFVVLPFLIQLKSGSTKEILRRQIGVFLHFFVKHINAVVQGSIKGTQQLAETNLSTWHTMVYSAHDTDVAYVLAGFGVYDQRLIGYSAAIALELIGPGERPPISSSNFLLRIRYKRGWRDLEGKYVQFPSCRDRLPVDGCPWTTVLEQIQPLLVSPEQLVQLCSTKSYTDSYTQNSPVRKFVLISALLCASLVLVLLSVFLIRRLRRRKHLLQDDEQVVFVRFDQNSL